MFLCCDEPVALKMKGEEKEGKKETCYGLYNLGNLDCDW